MQGYVRSSVVMALSLIASVPAQEQQTIKSTSRLVQVNVLVRDGNGNPLTNLTKDDFTLQVSGKPHPIQLFSAERNVTPSPPPAQPAPQILSNRTLPDQPNLVIVLFDELNTTAMDVATARKHLLHVFTNPELNSRTALYVLGNDLKILRDFIVDRAALAAAVAAHPSAPQFVTIGSELGDLADAAAPAAATAMGRADLMVQDARDAHRVRVTLGALETIAAHIAGIPGRKTLIWVTGGLPFIIGFDPETFNKARVGERNLYAEALQATRMLSESDVTIDVVDARGVQTDDQSDLRRRRSASGRYGETAFKVDRNYEAMVAAAKETGGEVFRNTNDIGRAVERAIEASSVTYTLGFYVPSGDLDGRFHPIKVSVKQRGTQPRCRTGFLATPDVLSDKQVSGPLQSLLGSPLSRSDISLRLEIRPEAANRLKLTVHIGPEGMTLTEENGKWNGTFEWMAASGRNGAYDTPGRQLKVSLNGEAYRDFMAHGLTVNQIISSGESDNEVGVAIRDAGSGAIGTLRLFRRISPAAIGTQR